MQTPGLYNMFSEWTDPFFGVGESVPASDRHPARCQVSWHGSLAAFHVQWRGQRLQRTIAVGSSHGPDAAGQGTGWRPIQTLPQHETSKFLLGLKTKKKKIAIIIIISFSGYNTRSAFENVCHLMVDVVNYGLIASQRHVDRGWPTSKLLCRCQVVWKDLGNRYN